MIAAAPSIFERLVPLIARTSRAPAESIVPTARLGLDLGLDSLELVEIVLSIEEAFALPVIDDDAALEAETVADLVALIERLSAAGPAASSRGQGT